MEVELSGGGAISMIIPTMTENIYCLSTERKGIFFFRLSE
jgi:hypothetical protein